MSLQGWIVLAIAAAVAVFCLRKFTRTLARKGEGAGCCCEGRCGKAKRPAAPRHP
jgi:hypothetical protein